jgi:RHS repeat-associated protein
MVAQGCCLALLMSMGSAPTAQAAARFPPRPLQQTLSVPVRTLAAKTPAPDPAAAKARKGAPPAATLPGAGAVEVALPAAQTPAAVALAGAVPVSVSGTAVSRARVATLDQTQAARAGLRGVLLRVGRADGGTAAAPLTLSVQYSSFRNAYGGDWASRLQLLAVPECALTTPNDAGCRPVPVPSTNDVAGGRVTGQVLASGQAPGEATGVAAATSAAASGASSSGALFALAASASGSAGDFSATSLAPSATWQSGSSTGDFSWSYPMRSPPAPGGPVPQLVLSYSSQSVDGRNAASNNQPSWIGEGFEMWPGYIERRYKACADDMGGSANNTVKTGDLCWGTDNAVLSLGGSATELVRDDATGAWRPKADDGSRIERFTGGPNGDNFGQYWRVTTGNGTQYWFGLNHLPGWTAGRPATNSTWTVPVYGNNPGEPCHQSSFDASWCQQAWRWNLDYVVDPHGSSMSYWYGTETNQYGRNLDQTKVSSYVRGGYLNEIDYGTRTEAEFGTPPMRVLMTVADRCAPNTPCDSAHPASWPDVPWDQSCTGSPCSQSSPTFWTQKRLAGVKTQVWGGSAYRDVESWTLNHTYPDPGDGTRAGLWLAGISHGGLVGGAASVPDITFTGIQMPNRVDPLSYGPLMNWWRVAQINTETGGMISIRYSDRDCVAGSRMPSSPDSNTLRCFPVIWTPMGHTSPVTDWFHKYVVLAVSETDLTGGSPRVANTYTYVGNPAWHFDDDDGLVPPSRKSWAQWRGYGRVQVYHGDPGEQSETETLYFRGMDGDKLAAGGTKSMQVTASDGVAWTDSDALAGSAHEQIVYNGPGGAVISGTISDPWLSAATATRTINGTTVYARHSGTAAATSRTALDGGRGWRTTKVVNTYDSYGMIATTDDLGDLSTSNQEACYRYTYARNTSAWLMSYQSRVEKYALGCAQTPTSADDVIGDARTSFDGQAYGTPPSKGDVTRVEAVSAWDPTAGPTYVTNTTSAYDVNGRPTDKWDVLNNHSTIAYSPATGGPVTSVTTTNPLGHTATAQIEPAWGEVVATVDANGRRTDLAFDPLGRLTSVWLPGRVKGTDSPNSVYQYLVRTNGAVAVTTQTLNPAGNYVTSYALYDGLLRPRQTQASSPGGGGGMVLTDTLYNTAGQVKTSYGAYYNSGSPGTNLLTPVDPTLVDDQTATVYDGAGRIAASIFQPGGHENWRTTTAYGGDRFDNTPPAGGTATSTVTDARGRTVELRQYHSPNPSGAYDSTVYAFNRKGLLSTVTDPLGNRWSYAYDLRGRQVTATNPDSGTTTSVYDDANELLSSTDSRGLALAYDYDVLGRRVDVRDGSSSGPLRAQWLYDTLAKGHLTSSTRYVNGSAYTTTVRGYTTRYDPTGVNITIPAVEGALAGTYSFGSTYFADGSLASTSYPAAGGLSSETVAYAYDPTLGLPTTTSTPAGTYATSYVTETDFSVIGQLLRYTLQPTGGSKVWQTYNYQPGTNRLSQSFVDREAQSPANLSQRNYTYDPAGNITQVADQPTNQTADVQCFNYDYLRRLTQAWTPGSGDCTAAPSASGLGGAAPYWQQWSYDATGNRLTETDHATANGDVSTSYSSPAAGAPQPHTLLSSTVTDSTGTRTNGYAYDAGGNTLSRPGANGQQQLSWDAEGRVSSVTDSSGPTSFVYDADGSRLVRRDPAGTTLYLPGTELRLSSQTGQVSATRYYSHAGLLVAMRTAAGVSWLMSDQQGTGLIAISASDQTATERRETPFGNARGSVPAWPNGKGFVGGTVDPDGLVHLGARDYDPSIGRFISADPVVDHGNPQQVNGYAYADNSPVTMSDADGRRFCDGPAECQGASPMPSHNTSDQPAPTSDPPRDPAPKKSNNGGSGHWWDQAWNKAKSGFHAAVNWAEQHKAEIAGVAVGIAVGVGCGVAIGWTGVGAVACGALAGAVGSMVTYALATPAKERSLGGLLVAGAIGAATGALTVGIGAKVAPLVGSAARSVARSFGGNVAHAVVGYLQGSLRAAIRGPVNGAVDAIPHGFSSPAEFGQFGRLMSGGLDNAGWGDVSAAFKGSSVTGFKWTTGEAFDEGRVSDFDIALGGANIFHAARVAGADVFRFGGMRTAPLTEKQLGVLGLDGLRNDLENQAGRAVNIQIYPSLGGILARGPSIIVR